MSTGLCPGPDSNRCCDTAGAFSCGTRGTGTAFFLFYDTNARWLILYPRNVQDLSRKLFGNLADRILSRRKRLQVLQLISIAVVDIGIT